MYIYIGFSTPKTFKIGAEIIKFFTKSPYSHAYIRLESEKIQTTIYHAAHGMVHFKSEENFKKDTKVIKEYKIETNYSQKIEVLKRAIDLSGEKYSFWELVQILLYDFANEVGVKTDHSDLSGYICSELVGKILEEVFNYKFKKPTYLLKPKDIDLALQEANVEVVQLPTQTAP